MIVAVPKGASSHCRRPSKALGGSGVPFAGPNHLPDRLVGFTHGALAGRAGEKHKRDEGHQHRARIGSAAGGALPRMARERAGQPAAGADGLCDGNQEPAEQCTRSFWKPARRRREASAKGIADVIGAAFEPLAESFGRTTPPDRCDRRGAGGELHDHHPAPDSRQRPQAPPVEPG